MSFVDCGSGNAQNPYFVRHVSNTKMGLDKASIVALCDFYLLVHDALTASDRHKKTLTCRAGKATVTLRKIARSGW